MCHTGLDPVSRVRAGFLIPHSSGFLVKPGMTLTVPGMTFTVPGMTRSWISAPGSPLPVFAETSFAGMTRFLEVMKIP